MALPFKVSTTQGRFNAFATHAGAASKPSTDRQLLRSAFKISKTQGEFNAFAPAEAERDGQLGTPTYADAELDAIIAARNENLRAKEAEQAAAQQQTEPAQQFSARPVQQRSNGRRRYGRELALEVLSQRREATSLVRI